MGMRTTHVLLAYELLNRGTTQKNSHYKHLGRLQIFAKFHFNAKGLLGPLL